MTFIRKAENKDIPRILELLFQIDMIHHRGRPDMFKGDATKYSKEQLEEILQKEDMIVFVSEDEKGYITGHVFCVHTQVTDDPVLTDIKTLYIDDICVDEKYRGLGIGRELYHYVEEYARSKDFYNITLNVYAFNSDAAKFYESLGMKIQKVGMEQIL